MRVLPMKELRINENDGSAVIEGHAAVFDSWSETLGGIFPFKEIVRKGAFNESIGKDDIRALFNHDPNYVLGRNRAGTLELVEDEVGLRVRISPPETSWARDVQTSIRRGDISQMSIGFVVEDDEWRTENGMDVRELRKVKLFDVSPVTFPHIRQRMSVSERCRSMRAIRQNSADKVKRLNRRRQRKPKSEQGLLGCRQNSKIFEEEQHGYQEGIGNEGKERGCQAQSNGCTE